VVHPITFDDKKPNPQRKATLELLQHLNSDASPLALGKLSAIKRLAAFAPAPEILPATDILFDAWALTTIQGKMPGRPPVAPYLHGVAEWEPPRTSVAWREEVQHITDELVEREGDDFPQELLADYPLKPHELLSDRTKRVHEALQALIAEPNKSVKGEQRRIAVDRARRNAATNIWLIDDSGSVTVIQLGKLLDDDKKRVTDRLADGIVVLPPCIGGLSARGTLDGDMDHDADHPHRYDVADRWVDEEKQPRRHREFSEVAQPIDGPVGMALVRMIDTNPLADESAPPDEESDAPSTKKRFWHWYTRPRDAEDVTRASARPIKWQHHTHDVVQRTKQIVKDLELTDELRQAVVIAAELHDLGKQRDIWQRSIGNPDVSHPYAKSGKAGRPFESDLTKRWFPSRRVNYRHEFGSLLDVLNENQEHAVQLAGLSDEMRDVVLHLVAAHHGYARPHFPPDAYDHERYDIQQNEQGAHEVMRRYARLQRRYGRWGLAYLESLLRAADWDASANPSENRDAS